MFIPNDRAKPELNETQKQNVRRRLKEARLQELQEEASKLKTRATISTVMNELASIEAELKATREEVYETTSGQWSRMVLTLEDLIIAPIYDQADIQLLDKQNHVPFRAERPTSVLFLTYSQVEGTEDYPTKNEAVNGPLTISFEMRMYSRYDYTGGKWVFVREAESAAGAFENTPDE